MTWSPRLSPRNVLLNQIRSGAYERAVTEKKTHNFPLTLPEHLAKQAHDMLKSSYNLEFLGLRHAVLPRRGSFVSVRDEVEHAP